MLKLKYFFKYANDTRDDSPLYIFESDFADVSLIYFNLDETTIEREI